MAQTRHARTQDTEPDLTNAGGQRSSITPIVLVGVAALALVGALVLHATSCGSSGHAGAPAGEASSETPATPQEVEGSMAEAESPEAATAEEAPAPVNEELQASLAQVAQNAGMTCCVSFIDLTDGSVAAHLGDQQMASASMIKLLIAHTFLKQVHDGTQSLDATYTLQPQDLVGGTGTIIGLGAGATVTYRDALMRMIDVSDNVGANILIDAVGMDAINADAQELGLTQTQLNRRMMDEAAIANGIENYTCANDLATLLRMVYEGSFVDADSSALMLTALEQQEDWGGIRSGLPEGTVFAHKTGTLVSVRHDGGIVEGDHPYVLVVLCGGDGFYADGALSAMAQVAQVVSASYAA